MLSSHASLFQGRVSNPDGVSLFWRKSMFELVEHEGIHFNRVVDSIESFFNFSNEEFNQERNKLLTNNVGLIALLKHIHTNELLIVVNCHLHWDPRIEYWKLIQAQYLLYCVFSFWLRLKNKKSDFQFDHFSSSFWCSQENIEKRNAMIEADKPRIFIMGDFNSLPESGAYALFSNKQFDYSKHYPNLSFAWNNCFNLRSAYAKLDEPFTNITRFFTGCLDYIWSSGVESEALLSPEAQLYFQPTAKHPSDHSPLMARYSITPK
jgi:CCR4-NOT transcription complex subunit 6